MKHISKFALLILVVSILYLLISGNLLSTSPLVIAGQLIAIALSAWSRRSFMRGQFSIHAQPAVGSLLVTGPYKYMRHPMYSAALLFIWSSVLGHLAVITVLVGLVVTGSILVRIINEEQFLHSSYADYADYTHKTKRLIPFLV